MFNLLIGHVQVCILLVQNGMDVNDTNAMLWTPLQLAAYQGLDQIKIIAYFSKIL